MTIYAEVIGDPISHSKSPLIHGFWLEKLGIKADYRAHHVTPDALGTYIAMRREDAHWRGCNVTIPHKIAVLDYVDDPGGVGQSIGAANTIFRDDTGDLIATNTDAAGFYAPLADEALEGAEAIVIGSGGAARAVLFALAQAKIGHVTLLARSPLKATALLAHFGLKGKVAGMEAKLSSAKLLVNTSPLGMVGQAPLNIDLSPLAVGSTQALVYDIVYTPLYTLLLQQAADLGLDTLDGLEMLVGQAAVAFELFYNKTPPREHDAALREILVAA
jgi:shikimate dehydrogenase